MAKGYVCVAGDMHGKGVCIAGGHAWQGGMHGGGMHGGRGACVAGETATTADGMHPSGMHSCYE